MQEIISKSNFQKMEADIMHEVKGLIESFKFSAIYHSLVSPEEIEQSVADLKEFRKKRS